MTSEKNSTPKYIKNRFLILYGIIAIIFSIYFVRLFSLQIVQGANYSAQAEENRVKNISVQTTRGNITDRNGFILAENVPSFDVSITPANLPADAGTTEEIYRELSELIQVPVTNGVINDQSVTTFSECNTDFGIKEIVLIGDTNAPYQSVKVKCNVEQKVALIIKEKSE